MVNRVVAAQVVAHPDGFQELYTVQEDGTTHVRILGMARDGAPHKAHEIPAPPGTLRAWETDAERRAAEVDTMEARRAEFALHVDYLIDAAWRAGMAHYRRTGAPDGRDRQEGEQQWREAVAMRDAERKHLLGAYAEALYPTLDRASASPTPRGTSNGTGTPARA